jgi:tetratricopeptide (TPR) repeat protein
MAQATWHSLKCEAVRLRRRKEVAQAIERLLRAIEITEQAPDLSRETGPMLNYLADLYLQEGRITLAETAIRRALQANLSLPAPECSAAADDFMILARVLSGQARHREAYEAGSEGLTLFRQYLGTHDKFIAQIEAMVEELRRNRERSARVEFAPNRVEQGASPDRPGE